MHFISIWAHEQKNARVDVFGSAGVICIEVHPPAGLCTANVICGRGFRCRADSSWDQDISLGQTLLLIKAKSTTEKWHIKQFPKGPDNLRMYLTFYYIYLFYYRVTKHWSDLPHYHRAVIYSIVIYKLYVLFGLFVYQRGLKPTTYWSIIFPSVLVESFYQECGAEKLHKIHKGCSYRGIPRLHTQDSSSAGSVCKNIPVNICHPQTKSVLCFILPELIHQYPGIHSTWPIFSKLYTNNIVSTLQVVIWHS